MESPTKHHFNPACSLKPWAGEDDNVCQMRKINGQVIPRRVHPNATGFERDLYPQPSPHFFYRDSKVVGLNAKSPRHLQPEAGPADRVTPRVT